MGLFSKNSASTAPVSERQVLLSKYANARSNLLLVILFTLINIVLLITNSNSYFLFSASIPYLFANMGMYLCGKFPAEFYEEDIFWTDSEFLPDSFFAIMLVIAAVILLIYLACWFFSKKEKYGWLIAALVFFVLDTACMIFISDITSDIIIDVLFHVWVIFSLASGVRASFKLKKLPPEDEIISDATVMAEETETGTESETVPPSSETDVSEKDE